MNSAFMIGNSGESGGHVQMGSNYKKAEDIRFFFFNPIVSRKRRSGGMKKCILQAWFSLSAS